MLGDINYLVAPIKYTLVLTKPNKEPIISISNSYEIIYNPAMNAVNEISFKIDKHYSNGEINTSYNKLEEKYLIRLNNQEFFVISEIDEDEVNGMKEIIAYSLEFELSQKYIQEYEVTSARLYSDNSDIPGVMNLINSLSPSWAVGDIDAEILTKYRSFDVSNIDIYSFIVKNIQDAFECIAIFNTDDKTIDFKLLENIGTNASLFLSTDNLVNELSRNRSLENIATRVYGYGDEDLRMNAVNPYGGKSYIDNWSYYRNLNWMSQGLMDALDSQDAIVAANIGEFQTVSAEYDVAYEDEYGSSTYRTLSALLISGTNITFADNASDLDNYYNGWELLIDLPSSTNLDCAGQTATIVSYNGTTKIATIDVAFAIIEHTYATVTVTVIDVPENPVHPAIYAEGTYYISEGIGDYTFLQLTINKQAYFAEQETILLAQHASKEVNQDDLDILAETRTHLDYWNGELATYQALVDAEDAILDAKRTRLQELNVIMSIETNLTFAQLQELDPYVIETTYTNTTIVDENDLYDAVLALSTRMAFPRYEFTINASDFLTMVEYQAIRHRLKIGDIINVKVSDTEVVEVRLLSYEHDPDNDSLDMTFSSVNSILDATYELSEIIDSTSSAAGTLNTERFKYKTYVDDDQNSILQFMSSALDAANNAVKAGNNQEIIVDRTGITMREYDAITGGYTDEQLRLINNTIAITDDNWNSVKTAISPTGVFADVLVGRAILGTELQLEAEDGTFTVDALGTTLKNMSLTAIYDEGLGTERKLVLNGTDVIKVTIGGDDKLWIDSNGDLNMKGNINMSAGSVIQWVNIFEADENSVLAYEGTYIDGNGVYTGEVQADLVKAGTLGAIGESITLGANVTVEDGMIIEWTDGIKLSINGLASYVGADLHGPSIDAGEMGIFFYDTGVEKGRLDFDTNPDPQPGDSPERMFLKTGIDVALKLESRGDADISIVAGGEDVWFDGNIHLLPQYKIYGASGDVIIGEDEYGVSNYLETEPVLTSDIRQGGNIVEIEEDVFLLSRLVDSGGDLALTMFKVEVDNTTTEIYSEEFYDAGGYSAEPPYIVKLNSNEYEIIYTHDDTHILYCNRLTVNSERTSFSLGTPHTISTGLEPFDRGMSADYNSNGILVITNQEEATSNLVILTVLIEEGTENRTNVAYEVIDVAKNYWFDVGIRFNSTKDRFLVAGIDWTDAGVYTAYGFTIDSGANIVKGTTDFTYQPADAGFSNYITYGAGPQHMKDDLFAFMYVYSTDVLEADRYYSLLELDSSGNVTSKINAVLPIEGHDSGNSYLYYAGYYSFNDKVYSYYSFDDSTDYVNAISEYSLSVAEDELIESYQFTIPAVDRTASSETMICVTNSKVFAYLEDNPNQFAAADWLQQGLVGTAIGVEVLDDLLDVEITDPLDREILVYDSLTDKWINEQKNPWELDNLVTTFNNYEDSSPDNHSKNRVDTIFMTEDLFLQVHKSDDNLHVDYLVRVDLYRVETNNTITLLDTQTLFTYTNVFEEIGNLIKINSSIADLVYVDYGTKELRTITITINNDGETITASAPFTVSLAELSGGTVIPYGIYDELNQNLIVVASVLGSTDVNLYTLTRDLDVEGGSAQVSQVLTFTIAAGYFEARIAYNADKDKIFLSYYDRDVDNWKVSFFNINSSTGVITDPSITIDLTSPYPGDVYPTYYSLALIEGNTFMLGTIENVPGFNSGGSPVKVPFCIAYLFTIEDNNTITTNIDRRLISVGDVYDPDDIFEGTISGCGAILVYGETLFLGVTDYMTDLSTVINFTISSDKSEIALFDTFKIAGTDVSGIDREFIINGSSLVVLSSNYGMEDYLSVFDFFPGGDERVYTEYSIDGSSFWHDAYVTGDLYIRHNVSGGAWSDPIRNIDTASSDAASAERTKLYGISETAVPGNIIYKEGCRLNESQIVYYRYSSGDIYCLIGDIDINGDITMGDSFIVDYESRNLAGISLLRLSDTKFVVFYEVGYLPDAGLSGRVLGVTGSTITALTAHQNFLSGVPAFIGLSKINNISLGNDIYAMSGNAGTEISSYVATFSIDSITNVITFIDQLWLDAITSNWFDGSCRIGNGILINYRLVDQSLKIKHVSFSSGVITLDADLLGVQPDSGNSYKGIGLREIDSTYSLLILGGYVGTSQDYDIGHAYLLKTTGTSTSIADKVPTNCGTLSNISQINEYEFAVACALDVGYYEPTVTVIKIDLAKEKLYRTNPYVLEEFSDGFWDMILQRFDNKMVGIGETYNLGDSVTVKLGIESISSAIQADSLTLRNLIQLTGATEGAAYFDGSENIVIETTAGAHTHVSADITDLDTEGPTSLDALSDVEILTPANEDHLVYNSTTSKWNNEPQGASGSGVGEYRDTLETINNNIYLTSSYAEDDMHQIAISDNTGIFAKIISSSEVKIRLVETDGSGATTVLDTQTITARTLYMARIDDTKAVAIYGRQTGGGLSARVINISGSTLSFGTEYLLIDNTLAYNPYSNSNSGLLVKTGTDTFAHSFYNGRGNLATVLTFSVNTSTDVCTYESRIADMFSTSVFIKGMFWDGVDKLYISASNTSNSSSSVRSLTVTGGVTMVTDPYTFTIDPSDFLREQLNVDEANLSFSLVKRGLAKVNSNYALLYSLLDAEYSYVHLIKLLGSSIELVDTITVWGAEGTIDIIETATNEFSVVSGVFEDSIGRIVGYGLTVDTTNEKVKASLANFVEGYSTDTYEAWGYGTVYVGNGTFILDFQHYEYPDWNESYETYGVIKIKEVESIESADSLTAKRKIEFLGGISGKLYFDGSEDILFDNTLRLIGTVNISHTSVLTSAHKLMKCINSTPITVTIPLDSAVAYPKYTEIKFTQYGTGTVTFAGEVGVTINSAGGNLTIDGQYTEVLLKRVNIDEWLITGSLTT